MSYNEEALRSDPGVNFGRPYQQCTATVMDTIADPFITFDEKGVCNYCYEYREMEEKNVFKDAAGKEKLEQIVQKIKEYGKDKKYDCITGVSGGVDSTYLMLKAKQLGLRPLVVHFDNGWNSELAVKNIENIISKLGFDLYTLVVDWREFRDLQLSYLKANVVDIEALTDHAIIGTLYKLASENNIKYILSGSNIVTEAVLPKYWIFNKADGMNIKDIHKHYGQVDLKTYPFFSTYRKRYYLNVKKIETIDLLNYLPYVKSQVKEAIIRELDWKDYGGKHYESKFTKFYQGYILPNKFHIDKRKAHLSNLILSGQMTREAALEELKKPIYPPEEIAGDREFFQKKLGLTDEWFDNYLAAPRREHIEFKHEKGLWDDIPFIKVLRPVWKLVKSKREK